MQLGLKSRRVSSRKRPRYDWGHNLDVVGQFACLSDSLIKLCLESCTPGRATHAEKVKGKRPDKEG